MSFGSHAICVTCFQKLHGPERAPCRIKPEHLSEAELEEPCHLCGQSVRESPGIYLRMWSEPTEAEQRAIGQAPEPDAQHGHPSHVPPVRSPAEARVADALRSILTEASGWKAGLLLCTYRRPEAGEREVSMTHALGMTAPGAALDLVLMVERLRTLAAELEAFIRGGAPLPRMSVSAGENP